MTRRDRRIVTAAVMLGTALSALDVTVVSAAMPTIVGHVGGLSLYPWVFSSYLLASTITVPIYGKLADLYGRKRIYAISAVLFLVGSGLCGAATSMPQLILFRVVQGLGAGGVQPMTSTIVGDIYSVEQRGKVQGLFSGVWGVSSVVGPLVGGVITQYISWRGIFYMNLPFGLLSIVLLWVYLHEQLERRRPRIDYLGAVLLAVGVTALLLGIQEGGVDFPWYSAPILGLLALAVVCLALFVWQEFRAPEPMLPPRLIRQGIIAVSTLGALLLGTLIVVIPSYLPLYVQGVEGGTALIAGIALAPLSVFWPGGSYVCGVLVLRVGYRVSALVGVAFSSVGLALLVPLGWLSLSQTGTAALILVGMGLAGFGLGILSLTYLIAVQNSVSWSERGVATAFNQFARTIGGAVGVAAMGAVLNTQLMSGLAAAGINLGAIPDPTQSGHTLTLDALLRPETRATLPADLLTRLVDPLGASLHILFIMMAALAVLGFIAARLLPAGAVSSKTEDAAEPAAVAVEAAGPTSGGGTASVISAD
ncbi:MAG TPA: MDR family MFS transporter [Ktedonobacterales bacterium]|nr:MDR family MFS transporter [Ktedonobacterales bacterium]